ncbi:unnamed protein product, partial [Eruca vesicaria subsp. sativa]|nr:unnamed protein product [Eruca vesicaria subsp. sativa]
MGLLFLGFGFWTFWSEKHMQKKRASFSFRNFLTGYYFCQVPREDYFQRAKPHRDYSTIVSCALMVGYGLLLTPDAEAGKGSECSDTGYYGGVTLVGINGFPRQLARAIVVQGAQPLFYPTAIGSEPQDQGLDA